MAKFHLPTQTIFYALENSIKNYRRYAQSELNKKYKDITLDQALILVSLKEQPNLSMSEIAEIVFKDNASVTRIVECLVQANYLQRLEHERDRRSVKLSITKKGNSTLPALKKIISSNRKKALKGIRAKELEQLTNTLEKLINNCDN